MAREFVIPLIPAPRLTELRNATGMACFQHDKMAPGRRFFDTVVVKGAFELRPDVLVPAPEPAAIALVDEYHGATDTTLASLKRAGDVLLTKPATDVIVTGTARPPGGRPARRWEVAVVVRSASETLLRHELVATGPRAWEHRGALRGWTLTDPEPTTELSIRYELAYGGAYRDRKNSGAWIVHEPNPSGIGFADEAALDRDRPHPAPQWELPDHPITALNHDVPLAGLGPIARPWLSRRRLAGTYDEAWERRVREEREHGLPPDYAPDFDPRFFQCAHPSLITREHLEGDESVGLAGLWPRGSSLLTRLPGLRVWASTCTREMVWTERRLPLDTVHIDLDAARVYLAWRLSLDQEQDVRAAVLYTEEGRST